jgi:general secretion pathway protein F
MPTFRYEAAHDTGRDEKGVVDADTARGVRAQLRTRGLAAIVVEPIDGGSSTTGSSTNHRGVAIGESVLAMATRQLASLLTAGLPLDAALATLAEQTDDVRQRDLFRAVRADVVAGQRLADALARHPRAFPRVYCATVSAGEEAGDFGKVLERLAQYLEDRQALRGRLIAAATYPAIVTGLAIVIVLFLMTSVVPQVVQVFEHTRQTLPWPTRALLAVSGALRVAGLPMLAVLIAGGFGLRALLRKSGPRAAWDRALLRLPVLGRLLRGIDTARFASTLAMLADAGVPMLRALAGAEATLSNTVLRASVRSALDQVREGVGLGRALGQTRAFPPVLIRLIEVGEATGDLPRMLGHAARDQTREVERRATAAAGLLEPALVLLMGVVVLAIVLAVLLPIIEINQLVR